MDKKEYRRRYYQEYYKKPENIKKRDERNKEAFADPVKKEKKEARQKVYRSIPENKKKIAEYNKKYHSERRKNDNMFKLRYQVYNAFNNLLKRGDKDSIAYMFMDKLGYSKDELLTRLKSTIPSSFIWGDYLKGVLQIDHIKPISKFKFTSINDDDFKKCWSLDNLQLLTKEDNLIKHGK